MTKRDHRPIRAGAHQPSLDFLEVRMKTGTAVWNRATWGFVIEDGTKKRYFFHVSHCIAPPKHGKRVTFELDTNPQKGETHGCERARAS
jgi:hypothetical protein